MKRPLPLQDCTIFSIHIVCPDPIVQKWNQAFDCSLSPIGLKYSCNFAACGGTATQDTTECTISRYQNLMNNSHQYLRYGLRSMPRAHISSIWSKIWIQVSKHSTDDKRSWQASRLFRARTTIEHMLFSGANQLSRRASKQMWYFCCFRGYLTYVLS